MQPTTANESDSRKKYTSFLLAAAGLCLILALAWVGIRQTRIRSAPPIAPALTDALAGPQVARMDSPLFQYSPGWKISPLGADPAEPADPWREPAGVVTFEFTGRQLALDLAVGDYWAYIFVTVDDAPANRLPVLPGNVNSLGQLAGYKPLFEPERQTATGLAVRRILVHQADDAGPHVARVEVWRGWGQTPLRAVSVDALPQPPLPLWPAVLFAVLGLWILYFAFRHRLLSGDLVKAPFHMFLSRASRIQAAFTLARFGLPLILGGIIVKNWFLCDIGLGLLVLAGYLRPATWIAVLLFSLPFYLIPLPILPGRSLNLIEIGVWGGLAVLAFHRLTILYRWPTAKPIPPTRSDSEGTAPQIWIVTLAAIVSLALVSGVAAEHWDVALREWRTVFLAAGAFALLLSITIRHSPAADANRRLLLSAWLAGGTAVAVVALWQYISGEMLITAEGVRRVRGFYGSPNNLALYLDRTVMVGLALALFTRGRQRWLLLGATGLQLLALLLTFSKGSLLLGMPVGFAVLAVGGWRMWRREGGSNRPLWIVIGAAALVGVLLLPFLSTERFQRLLDFSQGTTGFLRLHLWRSAWYMALDHPLLGVGPDNFLYAYRSGYILPAAWQDPNLNHPHNWLLDWWTRLGIPGLLLALLFFASGIRSLWRKNAATGRTFLNWGLLAAVGAALAHGLIDASYALPDLMITWVLLFGITTPSAETDSAESTTDHTQLFEEKLARLASS
jgi:O-antigen ligase